MVLAKGSKLGKYKVESLPDIYLLRVLGVRLGIDLTIQSKQPLGGPIVVKIGNRSIAIDSKVAEEIVVREVI